MAATLAVGGLLLKQEGSPTCAATEADAIKHKVWVWRFDVDGQPHDVRNTLAAHGLAIILKTHEGDAWMSEFDKSPTAITGPEKVREMASYFESGGVPFHAWCVVQGKDPITEAQLCSQVLDAGARSLTFDLEPSDGTHYWQGDAQAALAFGQELRRLKPNAQLAVAPDGRPWQIDAVPTAEFATFCNEIQPQTYWQTFNGKTNNRKMAEAGFFVGPEGMTPELILDASTTHLRPLGRPVRPIGQGTAGGQEWERFIRRSYELGLESVSVWRYGTTNGEAWPTLRAMPPAQPAPPQPTPTPEPPAPTATPADPAPASTPEQVASTEPASTPAVEAPAENAADEAVAPPPPTVTSEAMFHAAKSCVTGGG
jgi:hypothetical protein